MSFIILCCSSLAQKQLNRSFIVRVVGQHHVNVQSWYFGFVEYFVHVYHYEVLRVFVEEGIGGGSTTHWQVRNIQFLFISIFLAKFLCIEWN